MSAGRRLQERDPCVNGSRETILSSTPRMELIHVGLGDERDVSEGSCHSFTLSRTG
jgi:hypothetical protein